MNLSKRSSPNQPQWQKHITIDLLVPLTLILISRWIMPAEGIFQISTDESYQLAKVSLLKEGFQLYTDIWNDQPPLHTFLLFHWLKLFGETILAARTMTLVFATIFVWSFARILQQTVTPLVSFLTITLLITSSEFLELSQAIKVGLPSLSLGVLSIYLVTIYHQKKNTLWLISSGLIFACALQTKLITAIYIPAILLFLLLKSRNTIQDKTKDKTSKTKHIQNLKYPLFWTGCMLIGFILIGVLSDSLNLSQLLEPHLQAQVNADDGWSYNRSILVFLSFIFQDYEYVPLVLIGIFSTIYRNEKTILPITILGTVLLVFMTYRPLWTHYLPLLSFPALWLTGIGLQKCFDIFTKLWKSLSDTHQSKKQKLFKHCIFALLIIALLAPTLSVPYSLYTRHQRYEQLVERTAKLTKINQLIEDNYQPQSKWLFVDNPIYSFTSPLTVPPIMAVLSQKRFNTGNFNQQDVDYIFQEYKPAQVLFTGRQNILRKMASNYLKDDYELIPNDLNVRHYRRKA
ncbi:glycosyltransferase family 39 protein [[Limnothrix rosea] IAM M-220]|uniref:glycosyltransferase family 39 protein n=1 Tax=[Limnothrix rosea] IAM M-220 TaxID=454133 RepID=UPI0009698218|nr:glycosyltransferase family 39 protein [[Limnothrix rosea] IAM M-220]OKH14196.1 hypothetical protein NIES208_14210 [[Limnothrix rosea] IAM M-220]